MQLYHAKRLSLPDLIAKFTVEPARLLGLQKVLWVLERMPMSPLLIPIENGNSNQMPQQQVFQ